MQNMGLKIPWNRCASSGFAEVRASRLAAGTRCSLLGGSSAWPLPSPPPQHPIWTIPTTLICPITPLTHHQLQPQPPLWGPTTQYYSFFWSSLMQPISHKNIEKCNHTILLHTVMFNKHTLSKPTGKYVVTMKITKWKIRPLRRNNFQYVGAVDE